MWLIKNKKKWITKSRKSFWIRLRSIGKSDLDFEIQTWDFTIERKKSVLNVDSNLKHSNLDFVDFFIYRLNGKYENGFAKRFPWTVVFFPANYACTFKTTVLENSLKNGFSNFPQKKQKERISKKRFLSVEIRFRIWRSISNLKSGIQNPNPADFPIERNLSKLQFRKLLSSGSTFTPKWLSDLVLAVGRMMILSKTAF